MILVVGSTGTLGGMITRSLLERGEQVRILVRPHSSYRSLTEAGAEPVFGDLKDPASLEPACQGADVVVSTANSAQRGGEDNVEAVDVQGNRNLIDAAKAAGVKQFIFVSALGAFTGSPVPFFQAKALTEEYLKASGVPYTILSPNAFMEVWPGMVVGVPALQRLPVTVVNGGKRKHSFVSVVDVASFAVSAIGRPEAINATVAIGGPEPLSFSDCAHIYEQELGRPVPIRSIAPGEPVPGLPEFMAGTLAGMEAFDSPVDMSETARVFGVTPTPFAEVVRRQLAVTKQEAAV